MNNAKLNFDINFAKYLYIDRGLSAKMIANIFGYKTHKSILDKLKSSGVQAREGQNYNTLKISKVNSNFLNRIDSDYKAYFLGLLLSDGYFDESLYFISEDKELTTYVNLLTGFPHEFDKLTSYIPDSKNIRKANILSDIFVFNFQNIDRLGIVDYVPSNICGPKLSFEEMVHIPYIIRGMIDGDGTFGFPTNVDNSMYFRIQSASNSLLDWATWALNVIGMRNVLRRQSSDRGDLYEIYTAQPSNIQILANSIYHGNIGTSRNKNKILNFLM